VRSKDCSRESRAVGAIRARVLPGHEVGDGSDIWAPPVGVLGTRDPLVGGRRERGVAGRGEGKLGRGLLRALGREEGGRFWAFGPISRRGRRKINLSFFYLFKTSFKFNLKSV
jgi:hypothetical protein